MNTSTSPYPAGTPSQNASQGGTGLAIAALVCGIAGFCISPIGLVGIILGVVVLASSRAGRGMAIAGIAAGAVGMLINIVVMLGLLLPALAAARDAARSAKSQIQMSAIMQALQADAAGRKDQSLPPGGVDLQAKFASELPAAMWVVPGASTAIGPDSYLYVPPKQGDDRQSSQVLVLAENPELGSSKLNAMFADGSVDRMPRAAVEKLLMQALPEVYTTTGEKWVPNRRR